MMENNNMLSSILKWCVVWGCMFCVWDVAHATSTVQNLTILAQNKANAKEETVPANPYLLANKRLRIGRIIRAEVSETRPYIVEFPAYRGQFERVDAKVKIEGLETTENIKSPAFVALTLQVDPQRTLNIYDYQLINGVKRYRCVSLMENAGAQQTSEIHMVNKNFSPVNPMAIYTLYFIVEKPSSTSNPSYVLEWMLDPKKADKTTIEFQNLGKAPFTPANYLVKNRNLYQQTRDAKAIPSIAIMFDVKSPSNIPDVSGMIAGVLASGAKISDAGLKGAFLDLTKEGSYANINAGKVVYNQKNMGYAVSLWVKTNATTGEHFLWSHGNDFASNALTMKLTTTKFVVSACGEGETFNMANTLSFDASKLTDDKWHMITLSVSPDNVAVLYLDEESVASSKGGLKLNLNTRPLLIGIDMTYAADKSWLGSVDELRVFNTALTQNDVKKLFVTR